MLMSCAVLLPAEGVVHHVAARNIAETRMDDGFGDIAYGEGDFGTGLPYATTTTIAVTTTTTATSAAPAPPGTSPQPEPAPTLPVTPPQVTTTTIEVAQASSNNAPPALVDIPNTETERKTSLVRWVTNPLGELLERHTDDFPKWAKDVLVTPLATAGYLWLPAILGGCIWMYLRYQHRLDANEEKIVQAPMFGDEPVEFDD
jgi:hypothetical protein